MSKKIPLYITVDEEQSSTCGRDCPFLDQGFCLLFSDELEDTTLHEDEEWNDVQPTKERCFPCSLSFSPNCNG